MWCFFCCELYAPFSAIVNKSPFYIRQSDSLFTADNLASFYSQQSKTSQPPSIKTLIPITSSLITLLINNQPVKCNIGLQGFVKCNAEERRADIVGFFARRDLVHIQLLILCR